MGTLVSSLVGALVSAFMGTFVGSNLAVPLLCLDWQNRESPSEPRSTPLAGHSSIPCGKNVTLKRPDVHKIVCP